LGKSVESALRGLRVLVVQDEYRLLATEEVIDGAILDMNLRSEMAHSVADALRERAIPFVLATGYEQWALPGAHKDISRCDKPVDLRLLTRTLFG